MHFIYSYDLDSFTKDIKVGRAPIGATWYLYVSLYFYMSFYLSAKYIKHILGQWALLLLLSFAFLLFVLSTGDVWRYWAAPSFVMLSGVVYCYYESSIRNVINKNKKFTLSLIPLCMIVFFLVMRAIPYSSYLIHALYPIPIVWLTYFVNIPEKFCYVGIISFEIYLVHDSIISHVLPLALPHHIYVLFVVIITLPLAVLLNLFNKKVLYKL